MGNGNCKRCCNEIEEIIYEFTNNYDRKKEIDFTKLNENMNNITFKNYEEKSKEKEESKKYIENINFEEEQLKFNDLMEDKISKEYLVDIELNNPEKQEERINNIEKFQMKYSKKKLEKNMLNNLWI